MDFAALMSKELGKSKKPSNDDTGKKYMKRADVEAQRRAEYLAEQKAAEEERQSHAAAKRKREEDAAAEKAAREEKRQRLAEESRQRREDQEWEEEQARRRRLGLPIKERKLEGQDGDAGLADGVEDVPDEELVVKLRELGQPAIMFGESHVARLRRYTKLTTVMTDGPIPTTLQLVEEKDMKVDSQVPKDAEGRKWLYRQLASYFTMVLEAYERAMEAEKQDTSASRNAYNAMVQTRENMKPVSSIPHPPAIPNAIFLTQAFSFSVNLRRTTWMTLFSRPLLKLSEPFRSVGTLTPTMGISASVSARPHGLLV